MYEELAPTEPLSQGDILDGCPLLDLGIDGQEIHRRPSRVLVVTQACDLAQGKTARVVVALLRSCQELVAAKLLTAETVKNQLRQHKMPGWYFLPKAPGSIELHETIVEMRELHTVPLPVLQKLVAEGKRVCRIRTPWREHLAQHFAVTYMRIGLPQPYGTEP